VPLPISSKIFQKRLHQSLEGLKGVCCIAEDVIILSRKDDEHDEHVRLHLQRCCETGISLDKDIKCRFRLQEIIFMDNVDPSKVKQCLG